MYYRANLISNSFFVTFLFWQTDSAHLSRRKMTSKIALTDSIRRSHTQAFKRLSLHTKRFEKWNYWVATGIHIVHCAGVTGVFSLCLWVSLCLFVSEYKTFIFLSLSRSSVCIFTFVQTVSWSTHSTFTMVPPRTATNSRPPFKTVLCRPVVETN